MKKTIFKILSIIIILGIITGGILLVKLGLETYNVKIAETKDTSLESLNAELVVAQENIDKKIEELNAELDAKQVECDKLEAEKSTAFFDDPNGDAYYEARRKYDKCGEEHTDIWVKIKEAESSGPAKFIKDKETRSLREAKEEIEEKIDAIKNPSLSNKYTVNPNKELGLWEICGGALIVIAQLFCVIGIYNDVVKAFHKVENSFSNIDVLLKKRWELIPNVVESVKGYSSYESDTLKEITKLRDSKYSNMNLNQKVSLNNDVSNAVSKLMVLKEDYPDLKANKNFLDLQKELSRIEDEIAESRIDYNDSVMKYNNLIKVFPNNMLVAFFKYDEIEMFKATAEEKEDVKVKL